VFHSPTQAKRLPTVTRAHHPGDERLLRSFLGRHLAGLVGCLTRPHHDTGRAAWSWSNVGTVASILIALAAAGFTGLQWREAHNQTLLQLKPHVDFDTQDDPDAPPVGIAIFSTSLISLTNV
jgi:hypothetical protein